MTEDDRDLAIFQRNALTPGAWAYTARSLKQSAKLLWQPLKQFNDAFLHRVGTELDVEPLRHSPAHLLLCGYAIETMLKAAAIQRTLNRTGPAAVLSADGSRRQRWVTTHETSDLINRAGIDGLSATDLQAFSRFQEHVEWAGRYPTDRSYQSPAPRIREGWSSWDHETFERLFEIAEQAYAREAAIRDQNKITEKGGA